MRRILWVFAVVAAVAACGDDAGGGTTTTLPGVTTTQGSATTADSGTTTEPATPPSGLVTGSAALEVLRAGCEDGEYVMCDVLFFGSPSDSDLEAFGDSCGGLNEPAGFCATIYGVDIDLVQAEAACTSGDMLACDTLFMYSPIGSAEESFGESCGGLGRDEFTCVTEYGIAAG